MIGFGIVGVRSELWFLLDNTHTYPFIIEIIVQPASRQEQYIIPWNSSCE